VVIVDNSSAPRLRADDNAITVPTVFTPGMSMARCQATARQPAGH
jgi:hypothetical protein